MNGAAAGSFLVATLLVGSIGLGCSREQESDLPDRHARQFLPFVAGWRLESEILSKPQKSPHMVIWEVSQYPPQTAPTPEQQRAADDLVERSHAAAASHGWYDYDKALADGFDLPRDLRGTVLDGRHHRNDAFMLDDVILDPDRPEYLMYYPTPDGSQQLVGFMYFARTNTERGPQIGGPLTVWHYHVFKVKRCLLQDILQVGWSVDGQCEKGVGFHRSPEMLHVWLVDRPRGPFSTSMHMKNRLGLNARFVAPEDDDFELFSAHLQAALWELDDDGRGRATEALMFLTFGFYDRLREDDPGRDDADLFEPARMKLLRLTQAQGRSMTMRRYIELATDLRTRKPELWAKFEEDQRDSRR